MCTYWVFLHISAVLLVGNYGMFSTAPPSSTERITTEISNTSDSNNTVTTAESTTSGNLTTFRNPIETSHENDSYPGISDTEYDTISTKVTPSTARTESTTHNTKPKPPPEKKIESGSGSYTGGIIILIFIIILIVLLLCILYFLRKKGRSYSFDLTRVDGPANDYDTPLRSDQQGISYEQTNKDLPMCLDYVQEDKSEEKTSPTANGCAAEKTEQKPANENDEQNLPEENSFSSNSSSTPPMKKVEFNLDLDLIGDSDLNDLNDLSTAESSDAPHNENNNNVSHAGRGSAEDVFTEISLDETSQQS